MLADVIKVCEIEWQTDGEEVDLPENVTIDSDEIDAFELEDEEQPDECLSSGWYNIDYVCGESILS